jgi:hypothetical protein
MRIVEVIRFIGLAALSLVALGLLTAQADAGEETFTAVVAQMEGSAAGKTGRLTMVVKEWVTEEERDQLYTVFKESGVEAARRVLSKKDVGSIRYSATLAWRLNWAYSARLPDGGRVVRLVTDRPITLDEAAQKMDVADGSFGLIELLLNKNGQGKGELFSPVKIAITEEGAIEVTSLGTEPQELTEAKKEK